MHKIFVSYHHARDQRYADVFRRFYGNDNVTFLDRSLMGALNSGDTDYIMRVIRTKGLKQSTVTIVLIGKETRCRKYVDWEIYSSLRPGPGRTRNGLLGVLLPGADERDLPARFADNYQVDSSSRQIGYARLVKWDDVRPAASWVEDLLWGLRGTDHRPTLTKEIKAAHKNREDKILSIQNDRPRMKRNTNCI